MKLITQKEKILENDKKAENIFLKMRNDKKNSGKSGK